MADDYTDAWASAQSEPSAPAAPQQGDDEYSKAWGNVVQLRTAQAQAINNTAAMSDPDKAARALELSKKFDTPASVIQDQLPEFEQRDAMSKSNAALANNHELTDWMLNHADEANAAHDDFQKLDDISKLWRAFSSGVSNPVYENRLGRDYAMQQTGLDSDGNQSDIAKYEKLDSQSLHLSGGFYGGIQAATSVVSGFLNNMEHGGLAPAAAASATGVGLPVAVGALATGSAIDMGVVASGQTYHQLQSVRGVDGQPLSEAAKQFGAIAAGTMTGAIGRLGFSSEGALAKDALQQFTSDSVANALARPTVQKAIANITKDIGKAGLTGASINGGMTIADQVGTEIAKQISPGQWQTIFNDPETRQRYNTQTADAIENGFMLFAGMHAAGHLFASAIGMNSEVNQVKQAKTDATNFTNVLDGVTKSKSFKRSPDIVTSFLQHQSDGTPVENVGIPVDKLQEFYQKYNVEPGVNDPFFPKVTDIAQQMRDAQETGGDVLIPSAEFARMAGTDAVKDLMPNMRLRPDGMTLSEAGEYEKKLLDLLHEFGVTSQMEMQRQISTDKDMQAVYDDVHDKYRGANYPEDQAKQYALLHATVTKNLADMQSKTAEALHAERPFRIKTIGKKTVAGVDYLKSLEGKTREQIEHEAGSASGHIDEAASLKARMLAEARSKKYSLDKNNPASVRKVLDLNQTPDTFIDWIKRQGAIFSGIKKSERRYMGLNKKGRSGSEFAGGEVLKALDGRPDLVKKLIKSGGVPLDELARRAEAAGWFTDKTGAYQESYADIDKEGQPEDVIDLLTKDASGERVYHPDVQERIDEIQPDHDSGAELGVSEQSSIADIAKAIQAKGGESSEFYQPLHPTFYSALQRSLDDLPQGKGSPEQWEGIINNLQNKGVKKEEIEFSGIKDWLKEQKGAITKAEIQEFLRANELNVHEIEKGEPKLNTDSPYYVPELRKALRDTGANPDEILLTIENDGDVYRALTKKFPELAEDENWAEKVVDDIYGTRTKETKFDRYQLPGGENYRELLLTMPPEEPARPETPYREELKEKYGSDFLDKMTEEEKQKYNNLLHEAAIANRKTRDTIFISSHFNEKNVLAHVRFNDRTDADGKKTLFMEEVQSDWHQKGRKEGYSTAGRDISNIPLKAEDKGGYWDVRTHDGEFITNVQVSEGFHNASEAIAEARRRVENEPNRTRQTSKVPDAPFKKTWHEFAFKRMLRYAVDNNYDKIGWTTGEQQADRYDLSNHIDEIAYHPDKHGTYTIQVADKNGVELEQFSHEDYSLKEIEDTFGKEIAEKIKSGHGEESDGAFGKLKTLSGTDLKVGGAGMRGFYDKILPNFADKYTKKWGGKVEQEDIAGRTQPYYTVYEGKRATSGTIIDVYNSRREAEAAVERYEGRANIVEEKGVEGEHEPSNVHTLEITPEMREAVQQGQPLFQGEEGNNPRGSMQMSNSEYLMKLFQGKNLSTPLHEMGHMFLDQLQRSAELGGGDIRLQGIYSDVRKWWSDNKEGLAEEAGVTPEQVKEYLDHKTVGEDSALDQKIYTAMHEQFARSFEAYLMEGKAPAPELVDAFAKFKAWLINIYKTVKSLGAPIDDNIRNVFDRMIATDDQIEQARMQQGLADKVADPAALGMTYSEGKAYNTALTKQMEAENTKLLKKAMSVIRREKTKWWQEGLLSEREQVEKELANRKDLNALSYLSTGEQVNGDTLEVEQKMNKEDVLNMLNGDRKALALLPRNIMQDSGGWHPDSLAERLGYGQDGKTGADLLRDLQTLQAQKKEVGIGNNSAFISHLADSEAESRMVEKHGDILKDGTIEKEAMDAIHGEGRAKLLDKELESLVKKGSGNPNKDKLTLAHMQEAVRTSLDAMPVKEAGNEARFQRAESKWAKEAQRALLKGDTAKAIDAKTKQLFNHLSYRESRDISNEFDKGKKLFDKFGNKKAIKSVEQSYTDQIHALLMQVGYKIKRTQVELLGALKGVDIISFARERLDDPVPKNLMIPYFLIKQDVEGNASINPDFHTPVDKMTVSQFRAFKNLVSDLRENGADEKKMIIEGQKVDKEKVLNEIADNLKKLRQQPQSNAYDPADEGTLAAVKDTIGTAKRGLDAMLVQVRQLMYWADGRDRLGILNRSIIQPLKEAQYKADGLKADLERTLKDELSKLPKGWEKSLKGTLPNSELMHPDTEKPMLLTRKRMLAIMLNMGNESNFKKLSEGMNWDRDAIKRFVDTNASKDDWHYVTHIWKAFDKLWPELEALERRTHGFAPEKVVPTPIDTQFGQIGGGYYPAIYDAKKSKLSLTQLMKNTASDYFGGGTTRTGASINRIENYTDRVALEPDLAAWKLMETAHDISYREAIKNAGKVIYNSDFRNNLVNTFGQEYYDILPRWLTDVRDEGRQDPRSINFLTRFIDKSISNATSALVGFNPITVAKHGISALVNVPASVGMHWFTQATKEYLTNPITKRAWAMDKFAELTYRKENIDRDLADKFKMNLGQNMLQHIGDKFREYSHAAIAEADLQSCIVAAIAGYRKAFIDNPGISEKDAVYLGNQAILDTHGGRGIQDYSEVQKSQMLKPFTMFYGFFNRQYNNLRDTSRLGMQSYDKFREGDFSGAKKDFASTLGRSFAYLVFLGAIEQMLSGGGPDDDESYANWFGRAAGGQALATVPFLRDAAGLMTGEKKDVHISPLEGVVENMGKSFADTWRMTPLSEKEPSARAPENIATTASVATGLPILQATKTLHYFWDYIDGDNDPDTFGDFINGVARGPTKKK